ncbi:MAG: peptide-methionine (S)-S-oxide reductase MsrA [Salinisphaera sp.]|nr:peptide-methionine (S)-S-oxide reductase MsrA [Salinisphaera sp.]
MANKLPGPDYQLPLPDDRGEAVLAGGCFWCTEAVFQALAGVTEVTSGYAGGNAADANYEAVCTSRTGHAEAIRVRYDPQLIRYGALLQVFFSVAHDPTQVDRQGTDMGKQYRSAIFYADENQRRAAAAYIDQLNGASVFDKRIATTLEALEDFYPAEDYHQDFAASNPAQPYVCMVAAPKVDKLRATFPEHVT